MRKYFLILVLIFTSTVSCQKKFLDLKRNKKEVIPTKLADFEAILNNTSTMNQSSAHAFALIGADDYYITSDYWNSISNPVLKNGYIWGNEIYEGMPSADWNYGYKRILYSNIVLEGIEKNSNKGEELEQWNSVEGSALFFRGSAFFYLSQLFAKQYIINEENNDLGIPLRLESDLNLKVKRATVNETYDRIIRDLNSACELLPEHVITKYLPSKQAAFGMLARVYLQMGDYENALKFSNKCIKRGNGLLDYNSLEKESAYPFPDQGTDNKEVIFVDMIGSVFSSNSQFADTNLMAEYKEGDLRTELFWEKQEDGVFTFIGSYYGSSGLFTGLALDEVFLIRAECNVRLNNDQHAIEGMNEFLRSRISSRSFGSIPSTIDKSNLLEMILNERYKQLAFRGLRWSDLKRLNSQNEFNSILYREINNDEYKLEPGDLKYVWPIPYDAIDLGGLQQNPR